MLLSAPSHRRYSFVLYGRSKFPNSKDIEYITLDIQQFGEKRKKTTKKTYNSKFQSLILFSFLLSGTYVLNYHSYEGLVP